VGHQHRDRVAAERDWSTRRQRAREGNRHRSYVPGEDSYRSALERAREVSPDYVPCSWCGKPTPGPDLGVILCATCLRPRR
jgi:hypothetical protein